MLSVHVLYVNSMINPRSIDILGFKYSKKYVFNEIAAAVKQIQIRRQFPLKTPIHLSI